MEGEFSDTVTTTYSSSTITIRHHERKLKHLNKQKEGKKRLRAMSFGRVQIPQESFLRLFEQQ